MTTKTNGATTKDALPDSGPIQQGHLDRLEKESPQALIQIDRIAAETWLVPVEGTSPLIVHRFSEKAKRQMLDNMQGRKSPKESKNPQAEYDACFYKFQDGRTGFPASGFQQATISGARFYHGVTMTSLRQGVFFRGDRGVDGIGLFEITGEPEMREDVVTVGRGTDLRYRPIYHEWSAVLRVTFVASMLDRRSLISLIDAGGMGVGVGEWRPEKNGEFGCYQIDHGRELEQIA